MKFKSLKIGAALTVMVVCGVVESTSQWIQVSDEIDSKVLAGHNNNHHNHNHNINYAYNNSCGLYGMCGMMS